MPGNLQAFPTSDFADRLQKVRRDMRDRALGVLVLHSPENIYYLAGYQTSGYFAYQALIVGEHGDPILLCRYIERGNVPEYSWLEAPETWREGEDVVERTAELVRRVGGERATVGVEKNSWFLTVAVAERLRAALPYADLVDASLLVDRVRLIKSPNEICYLRRAGEIAETEIRAAIETTRAGVAEADVAAAVLQAGVAAGCEYTGLPHHIMSGYRFNVGHANWGPKTIVTGELVRLELYGCVARYHATQIRTLAVGVSSREVSDAARIVIDAQNAALTALKPGASSLEVDRLMRGPVRAIRPDYYNRTGYSIGIGFPPRTGEWDALDFNEQHDWEIKEGMVFHVLTGAGGFGISETVAITASGAERLTPSTPRELIVV